MAYVPSICPKCRKSQYIKEVCGHCGHEYLHDRDGLGVALILTAFSVTFLLVLMFRTFAFIGEVHERVKVNNISWSLAFHKEALDWGFIKEKENER